MHACSFTKKDAVIVLGATNTGEALDKALTRPGRFDQQIHFILPDVRGRKEILELYVNKLGESAGDCIRCVLDLHKVLQGLSACWCWY